MTLEELKLKMKPEDQGILDILMSMYKRTFTNSQSDEINEIGIYLMELELKYGKKFVTEFWNTEEFCSLTRGLD